MNNLDLKLNLEKPLVFLKVATTGMNATAQDINEADRIVEISIFRIEKDRSVRVGTKLVNPEKPIPQEATLINGITDADVANAAPFRDIAANLFSFIGDADFAGFSLTNFDLKFLTEEFNRAGIEFTIVGRKIIDLSSIYNTMEKRDFRAAVTRFTGKELSDAPISSETANREAVNILNGMMEAYAADERFQNSTATILHENFNRNKRSLDVRGNILLNKDGRPVFNFGKYKNQLIGEMLIADGSYYDWCVNVSDLPADTKLLIKKITDKARTAQNPQPQN